MVLRAILEGLTVILVLLVVNGVVNFSVCSGFSELDLETRPHETIDEWFDQVNLQYLQLNRYSAYYMWELSTNPTTKINDEASLFGGIRSRWITRRCNEATSMIPDMTRIQKRMVKILCRGPKYTNYQGSELSEILGRIEAIYTETEVCLPKTFDICVNYNRIWDYTYVRNPSREFIPLNMSAIVKDRLEDANPLHFFDGKISHDYYVFRGVSDGQIDDEDITDYKIRRSQMLCMGIEPELENLMAGNFVALQRPDCALPPDVIFRWAWEAWRLAVGPEIAKYYPSAVYIMNLGANNNGYSDIGEAWRDELEMGDLRDTVDKLWSELKPYYEIVHAVFRNALWIKYEDNDEVTRDGPLPAHLMGNMWSQDWSAYQKLLVPLSDFDLDDNLRKTNWTSKDMTKRADDFYSSMGLNPMPEKFWKFSQFDKSSNTTKCHGSAANMFNGDDYRMVVCAERTFDDFYTIIHEMGHLQYYMHSNAHQPALFQDAPNSALSESIGDAIFLAMMTPSHLNRLGLLPDKHLFADNQKDFDQREMRLVHEPEYKSDFVKIPTKRNILEDFVADPSEVDKTKENSAESYPGNSLKENVYGNFGLQNDDIVDPDGNPGVAKQVINVFDLTLLLKVALSKIPQIPFEYILDVFRWSLFDGSVPFRKANTFFWKLILEEQGIKPPNWENRSKLFDAAAKFHIADNTPYVRYFLASILQVQIFKGLCEMTVFGRVNTEQNLPLPLHRCDIYGSKRAGKVLKKALKLGASKHWSEVLYILTGKREVSVEPFIEYYQPLFQSMKKLIKDFEIPVGW